MLHKIVSYNNKVTELLIMGNKYFHKEAYLDAFLFYKRALKLEPFSSQTTKSYGVCLHKLHKLKLDKKLKIDSELEIYNSLIISASIMPNDMEAILLISFIFEELGNNLDAEDILQLGIENAVSIETEAQLNAQLGTLLLREKKHTDAIERFKYAIDMSPMAMDYYFLLIKAYYDIGEFVETINAAEQANKVQYSFYAASAAVKGYLALGQINDARREFRETLQMSEKYLDEFYDETYWLGKHNKFSSAVMLMELINEVDLKYQNLMMQAYWSYSEDKLETSAEYMWKATDKFPAEAEPYYKLMGIYAEQGKINMCLTAACSLYLANPSHDVEITNLLMSLKSQYFHKNQYIKLVETWNKFLSDSRTSQLEH
jgi:tetratricopeptide (TPR) repeat protein